MSILVHQLETCTNVTQSADYTTSCTQTIGYKCHTSFNSGIVLNSLKIIAVKIELYVYIGVTIHMY
jgi:hypothetical protein